MTKSTTLARLVDHDIAYNSFTPDLWSLQQKFLWIPVFLYGPEKAKFTDELVTKHYPLVGYGHTASNKYRMYLTKQEVNPVIIFDPSAMPNLGCSIRGEIRYCTPEDITILDSYFQNGCFFYRRWTSILWYDPFYRDKKEKFWKTSGAYIYTGAAEYWKTKMENLSHVPILSGNDGKSYYEFTSLMDAKRKKTFPQCS